MFLLLICKKIWAWKMVLKLPDCNHQNRSSHFPILINMVYYLKLLMPFKSEFSQSRTSYLLSLLLTVWKGDFVMHSWIAAVISSPCSSIVTLCIRSRTSFWASPLSVHLLSLVFKNSFRTIIIIWGPSSWHPINAISCVTPTVSSILRWMEKPTTFAANI